MGFVCTNGRKVFFNLGVTRMHRKFHGRTDVHLAEGMPSRSLCSTEKYTTIVCGMHNTENFTCSIENGEGERGCRVLMNAKTNVYVQRKTKLG